MLPGSRQIVLDMCFSVLVSNVRPFRIHNFLRMKNCGLLIFPLRQVRLPQSFDFRFAEQRPFRIQGVGINVRYLYLRHWQLALTPHRAFIAFVVMLSPARRRPRCSQRHDQKHRRNLHSSARPLRTIRVPLAHPNLRSVSLDPQSSRYYIENSSRTFGPAGMFPTSTDFQKWRSSEICLNLFLAGLFSACLPSPYNPETLSVMEPHRAIMYHLPADNR